MDIFQSIDNILSQTKRSQNVQNQHSDNSYLQVSEKSNCKLFWVILSNESGNPATISGWNNLQEKT